MVTFMLLHWLSSSHKVSKLWTKRKLEDDLVPFLPTHFQIWFIETQRSVGICQGFTSDHERAKIDWIPGYMTHCPSASLSLCPLINDLAWCPDTFFGMTWSQQLSECIAFGHSKISDIRRSSRREAGICTWNSGPPGLC